MPLHAHDEVLGRIQLDCLDDFIGRTNGCDPQIVSWNTQGW